MPTYRYVFTLNHITKTYPGGRQVLKDISLSFLPGAKIGVLGPNGAGKSTLLRIMAGLETAFEGEAKAAEGLQVGYLPQEPQLDPSKSVSENILEGLSSLKAVVDKFHEVSAALSEVQEEEAMMALLDRQAELQATIEAGDAWDLERKVEVARHALKCPPGDWEVTKLSGGERRRVALCRLLLSQPDLLLLDEPTNHLDAESVGWLQTFLSQYKGTVVMVTHDRYFLDTITTWILEIDRGRGFPFHGNYSAFLEHKQKRLLQENREDEALRKTIEHEREWINATPKARQAKSKARVSAYEDLLERAQKNTLGKQQISIPLAPRLGQLVLEVTHVTKAFGDVVLFKDVSFRVPPGAIVGIVGPNGAGKTSLFRLIAGQDTPTEGSLRLGESVKLGYVDQSRDTLSPTATVWEEISQGQEQIPLGKNTVPSRAYVASFNFKGTDQQKRVGQLSGGERNRVHLAKMLKSGANVLLLDEPTNDLDVETLRALEEALMLFTGCILVISHDRWFLDRVATHILAYEEEAVVWFEGNYQAYEQARQPDKTSKYRKVVA